VRRCPLLAVVLLIGTAHEARAQACATCSPLSLPSSLGVGDVAAGERQDWLLTARVGAGWLSYPVQSVEGQPFADPNQARLDLGLLSVEASAQHRSGFGGSLLLPAALIAAADVTGRRADPGLGDLDARARYRGQPNDRWSLSLNVGAALPTGRYAPRSGALALSAAAQALTPGRGTTWAVAEGEVRLTPHPRFSVAAALEGRVPLVDAPDGFRWGPEARALLDARTFLLDRRLAVGAALEGQWRGVSTVDDPFLGRRVESGSTGGFTLAVLPSATYRFGSGLFLDASLRVPLVQALAGLQFNQGLGAFIGVGFTLPAGTTRAEASRTAGRGTWSVVDYDAAWCAGCQTLRPLLAEASARRPSVRFERIDVTHWSQDELEAAVPGASALPVVELRRPDGSVARRLEGDAATHFEDHLQELLP
jgi:thiol-disulfide isomerase/thioredoxin